MTSLSAVVNTALRIVIQYRITWGDTFSCLRWVIHSRTSAGFHLMVGQPFFEHVPAEPLAAARGVAHPALGHPQLGTLPRLVGGILGGEGACRPAVSLDVVV